MPEEARHMSAFSLSSGFEVQIQTNEHLWTWMKPQGIAFWSETKSKLISFLISWIKDEFSSQWRNQVNDCHDQSMILNFQEVFLKKSCHGSNFFSLMNELDDHNN